MEYVNIKGFPYPIASAYEEFVAFEHLGAGPQFGAAVRLFSSILRYCAISAIGDYLNYLEEGGAPDPRIQELLYKDLFRPPLGKWREFLDVLLVFRASRLPDQAGFFAELDGFFFKPGRKKRVNEGQIVIGSLITLRNRWCHPYIQPEDSVAPALLRDAASMVHRLLDLLRFLNEYPLVIFSKGRIEPLMGARSGECVRSSEWKGEPLREGELYIVDSPNRPVPMHFLLAFTTPFGRDVPEYMLFETADMVGKRGVQRLWYVSGNHLGSDELTYVDRANKLRELLRPQQIVAGRRNQTGAIVTWPHLKACSHLLLVSNLKEIEGSPESGAKLLTGLYVARSGIEGAGGVFEQFWASGATCLPILGESGHGKTNLLGRLTGHPLLKEECAVLFFQGRKLHPQGLRQELEQDLEIEGQLDGLLRNLGEGSLVDKQVVVFVDAVNEFGDPEQLVTEILTLCGEQEGTAFRVIFSCRTTMWKTMRFNPVLREKDPFFRLSQDAHDQYPTLSVFTEDELASAFRKYSLAYGLVTPLNDVSPSSRLLLRDPLMLRFAAEAYSKRNGDGRLPRELQIEKVFELYDASRRIDRRRDEPFVNDLIAAMWDNGTDRMEGSVISRIENLARIVSEPPVGMAADTAWICTDCNYVIPGKINKGDRCPSCESLRIEKLEEDWRTTFERLQDERLIARDESAEDFSVRFVYDRYYEFRTARWLLEKHGTLSLETVRALAEQAKNGRTAILTEALKQAVLASPTAEELVKGLARSTERNHQDLAESCLVSMAGRAEIGKARGVFEALSKGTGPERTVIIRAAVESGDCADAALLARIPEGEAGGPLVVAVTQALYRIWRQPEGGGRGVRLMKGIASGVTPLTLMARRLVPLQILLDLTFRTLGQLHHDKAVVDSLKRFWEDLLRDNLWLGRTDWPMRWLSPLVRLALLNIGSRKAARQLAQQGIAVGGGRFAFTPAEQDAFLKLFDAMEPGSRAFEEIPKIMIEMGPDAPDEWQRDRVFSSLVGLFSIACFGIQAGHDLSRALKVFDRVFEEAGNLPNHGRGTRYCVCSGLNFSIQLHFVNLGIEALRPALETLLRQYRVILETHPETFVPPEAFKGSPNGYLGIFSESVVRMGGNVARDVFEPVLLRAEELKSPDLIKAYLRVSAFLLDTFSRRMNAHREFLSTLVHLSDFEAVSRKIGMDGDTLRDWVTEAYAVISVAYPSDAELFVSRNPKLEPGFFSQVRVVLNRPCRILVAREGLSLEQEVNKWLQAYSLADGAMTLMVSFPAIRNRLVAYGGRLFDYPSLKAFLRVALRDLLDVLASDANVGRRESPAKGPTT